MTKWTSVKDDMLKKNNMSQWFKYKDNKPKGGGLYLVIAAGRENPCVADYDLEVFKDDYSIKLVVLFWTYLPKNPTYEERKNERKRHQVEWR